MKGIKGRRERDEDGGREREMEGEGGREKDGEVRREGGRVSLSDHRL